VDELNTSSPITLRRTVEPRAALAALQGGDRVLSAHWPRSGGMGWPTTTSLGQRAGFRPGRPLWH
jgi:hypothetical protein